MWGNQKKAEKVVLPNAWDGSGDEHELPYYPYRQAYPDMLPPITAHYINEGIHDIMDGRLAPSEASLQRITERLVNEAFARVNTLYLIENVNESCFEKCVRKPDVSTLTNGQKNCLFHCCGRFFDTGKVLRERTALWLGNIYVEDGFIPRPNRSTEPLYSQDIGTTLEAKQVFTREISVLRQKRDLMIGQFFDRNTEFDPWYHFKKPAMRRYTAEDISDSRNDPLYDGPD